MKTFIFNQSILFWTRLLHLKVFKMLLKHLVRAAASDSDRSDLSMKMEQQAERIFPELCPNVGHHQ